MKYILLALLSINSFAFDHSHSKWNDILQKYTTMDKKQVLVDYKGIKKDKSLLESYLKDLESLKKDEFKKFSKDQQLAYWINVYNAYTVKWIIKHYPVSSIKKTVGFFARVKGGPWNVAFIPSFGKKISLDKVEHGIIRKQFKEPRIHFAVNCASIGCPSLYREAITHEKIDTQLEEAMKHFLTNTEKNRRDGNTYYLSKIFDWYGSDFGKNNKEIINYVQKYMGQAKSPKTKVEFLNYDWDLNVWKR